MLLKCICLPKRIFKNILYLIFYYIFGHSWKNLLYESLCGPDSLLVRVVGFTGDAYYGHNVLDTFRKKVTGSYCYTNTHKNFSQFYISVYTVHILILLKKNLPLLFSLKRGRNEINILSTRNGYFTYVQSRNTQAFLTHKCSFLILQSVWERLLLVLIQINLSVFMVSL